MNIFERASRAKLRFHSTAGPLTVEQLWDLPLIAGPKSTRDVKVDLDTVARNAAQSLREVTDDSFVQAKPDPRKPQRELALEIVKHVIASKQADAEAAETRARNQAEKQLLLNALADKKVEGVKALTEEELKARIAALDS